MRTQAEDPSDPNGPQSAARDLAGLADRADRADPADAADLAGQPGLAGRLAGMSYHAPFRRYQELSLEAFERQRAKGDTRFYLTMPPGSGKTVVGLEIARRLGRPTLILGPNTAIQAQWIAEWRTFAPRDVAASADRDLAAPISVLTYQSLAVLDRGVEDLTAADLELGEAAGRSRTALDSHELRRRRVLIARGGDHAAVLGLLHDNGREIVRRLAARGPVTLILDECHHLLDLWGHVLDAVLAELDPGTSVVGLTATPPRELAPRQASLHRRLFGEDADFEVVTPAVVKDGFLAPYQELAYLTVPTPAEQRWIEEQQARFEELRLDLLDPAFATTAFGAWFATRVIRRQTRDGADVAWRHVEESDPDLARAALRWEWSEGRKPPPGAHYREEHRRPPGARDWIALLDGYVRDVLVASEEPYDRLALERIRKALPSIGYVLTRHGIRAGPAVVDRVLALSAAKTEAAIRILEAESDVLGERLRAVVLCDFETASRDVGATLQGVLDPSSGSAAGALRTCLADPGTARLDPVLVSGRTVACSRSTAVALQEFARQDPHLAELFEGFDPLASGGDRGRGWEDLVLVMPEHADWTPRTWVPFVTAFFEAGGSRCLIGTRGLLGEGWNSRRANVLIDLGGATTSVSVQQVRGRTLRLDPADPEKVADNWDVVVVAEGHLRGNADYERFVRKHRHYYALAGTGEIESGVSHVDARLGPFGPPPQATHRPITEAMLLRPGTRPAVRQAWRIGEPYRDVPIETIRIRLGTSPGLPEYRVFRPTPADAGDPAAGALTVAGALGAAALLGAGFVADAPLVGTAGAAVLGGASGGVALARARDRLGRVPAGATLGDLGAALAEAMAATGAIRDRRLPLRIVAQPDGYYRCFLEGVSSAEARRFAEALEQVVEPLWDPRWIIGRRIDRPPASLAGTAALLVTRALRLPPGPESTAWHAVPDILARRRADVAAFERAWSRWVSPQARALSVKDPAAQSVLALRRGDDPFHVETQHRKVWT